MTPALVTDALAPLRREPDHRSEMVSQLLFGELVHLLGEERGWAYLRADADDYIGWTDIRALAPVDDAFVRSIVATEWVHPLTAAIERKGGPGGSQTQYIVKGSAFPVVNPDEQRILRLGFATFVIEQRYLTDSLPHLEESVLATARNYVNAPYLWGGRSPFGIDCSGLMQVVFRLHGVKLPRDASQQVAYGAEKDITARKAGDVAFFAGPEGAVTHVGLLTGPDQILHASGRVRLDKLTANGVYAHDTGDLTHKLHSVRTFFT